MERRAYPSDLTDAQWLILAPFLPTAATTGRPRRELREVINTLLYALRAGASWRLLPHDLVPWQTAYGYLQRWQRAGLWQHLSDVLVAHRRAGLAKKNDRALGSLTRRLCALQTWVGLPVDLAPIAGWWVETARF